MPRSSSVLLLELPCRQETFLNLEIDFRKIGLCFSTIYVQDIMAKRNQKPEVRKAQREQAVRAAKDQKKATVKKPVVKVRLINAV